MNLYELTDDELRRAAYQASAVALELGPQQPLLADALHDWASLALLELLVHALGGDRAEAERRWRRARSGSGN